MIDAVITRKIVSSCSHTLPVLVTCNECAETELKRWEARIKAAYKEIVADEWKQLEEQLKVARLQALKLQESNDKLARVIAQSEGDNKRLREEARIAHETIGGLRSQLHAEQAIKTFKPSLAIYGVPGKVTKE